MKIESCLVGHFIWNDDYDFFYGSIFDDDSTGFADLAWSTTGGNTNGTNLCQFERTSTIERIPPGTFQVM